MHYYSASRLADSFRTVRRNTLAIAEEIPDDKYSFRATPEVRSVAELLAHIAIATTLPFDLHTARRPAVDGAMFFASLQKAAALEKELTTKPAILAALTSEGERFASFLEGLSDGVLAETVSYPPGMQPPSKTRFEMLLGAKEHEMHHRGQLMLIQRMLGMVPPLTRARQAARAAAQTSA